MAVTKWLFPLLLNINKRFRPLDSGRPTYINLFTCYSWEGQPWLFDASPGWHLPPCYHLHLLVWNHLDFSQLLLESCRNEICQLSHDFLIFFSLSIMYHSNCMDLFTSDIKTYFGHILANRYCFCNINNLRNSNNKHIHLWNNHNWQNTCNARRKQNWEIIFIEQFFHVYMKLHTTQTQMGQSPL